MNGTLNVETAALVRHATGRYSDAMACDAIGHYVAHVGAVPDSAWGSLSWTQKWKTEWHDAVQDRVKEAGLACERFGDVGETLYQVAADYAHTDINVAADFAAIQNSPIMPFVTALEHPAGVTARGRSSACTVGLHRRQLHRRHPGRHPRRSRPQPAVQRRGHRQTGDVAGRHGPVQDPDRHAQGRDDD